MSIRTIYLAIRVVKNTLSDTRSKTNRRDSFYQRGLEEKMVHKVPVDTVRIITSSVSGMSNEFRDRLLCYIMETDYTEALTPICASLTNLAESQLHANDEEASTMDLPAPQKLLARLLGKGWGIAMFNLLKTLSQSIAPSMADMWELRIPLLVKYLEGGGVEEPQERGAGVALLSAEHTEFTWSQKTWEDRLIQFRRNSLKMTRGSRWSLRLSKELNNQIESFDSPSLEKLSPTCSVVPSGVYGKE